MESMNLHAALPLVRPVGPRLQSVTRDVTRWMATGLSVSLLAACQTVPLPADVPTARLEPAAAPLAQAVQPQPALAMRPAPTSAPLPGAAGVPAPEPALMAPADTWSRLRAGFAVPPLEHELVTQHAQRFARTRFLEARADRLRLYLPLIMSEVQARGVPLELALLPLVESALNPQARSPVGALGTWQFMAPTARRFELRTSRLVDDRKNLVAATRAAMDYLLKLHAQFGDWHLAMAAYNWGEGRVQQAVNRQRARGEPADFAALAPAMPAETRNYVPQIMALSRLVAEPDAWGVRLPPLPEGPALVEAPLRADIDLALLLKLAALTEREFLALNPAVKPPLVLAAATPRLLMPATAAERLSGALAQHRGALATWSVVKLQDTRPVEAIAAQHGASAASLREANGISRGLKPVAGSVLLVPVAPASGSATAEAVVATADLQLTADLVKVKTQVRRKESLVDVARRCGVSLSSLAGWNGLAAGKAKQRLREGTVLSLWVLRDRATQFPAPKERVAASQAESRLAPAVKPGVRKPPVADGRRSAPGKLTAKADGKGQASGKRAS